MKVWGIMKEENIGKRYKTNRNDKDIYVITKDINKFCLEIIIGKEYFGCVLSSDLLELDFEEVVDWSKVPVDTKILVRESNEEEWTESHFAKYEDGKIYAWAYGRTSFTIRKYSFENPCTEWKYAKLYEEGEE